MGLVVVYKRLVFGYGRRRPRDDGGTGRNATDRRTRRRTVCRRRRAPGEGGKKVGRRKSRGKSLASETGIVHGIQKINRQRVEEFQRRRERTGGENRQTREEEDGVFSRNARVAEEERR